jgi:hypothetical protein
MIAHMYDGQLCMLSGRVKYPYSAAVSTKLTIMSQSLLRQAEGSG